jgi:hypothetical protein
VTHHAVNSVMERSHDISWVPDAGIGGALSARSFFCIDVHDAAVQIAFRGCCPTVPDEEAEDIRRRSASPSRCAFLVTAFATSRTY